MNNILSTPQKAVANIGEEIGFELGKSMVKDYQLKNPNTVHHFTIGKEIISQILAQPGCEGIRFYKANDEFGVETLVYTGLDKSGNRLEDYTYINNDGNLINIPSIVADRTERGGGTDRSGSFDTDSWTWEV